MPRTKKKGATTKNVDSAIHKDQDKITSFDNEAEKDSTLLEKMDPGKKGKIDDIQNQHTNTSNTTKSSHLDDSNKECMKGNKCIEIDPRSSTKYVLELQKTSKHIGKDVHGEMQHNNSRNKIETNRDIKMGRFFLFHVMGCKKNGRPRDPWPRGYRKFCFAVPWF